MPNGKRYSGASGTAEFASSAIAFRRIDYRLKPRLNASASAFPRASPTDARGCNGGRRQKLAAPLHCGGKILRPRSRAAVKRARGVVALGLRKKDGERLRRPFQNT